MGSYCVAVKQQCSIVRQECSPLLSNLHVEAHLPLLYVGDLKQHTAPGAKVLIALHLPHAGSMSLLSLKGGAPLAAIHNAAVCVVEARAGVRACFWHLQQKNAPQEQVILLQPSTF